MSRAAKCLTRKAMRVLAATKHHTSADERHGKLSHLTLLVVAADRAHPECAADSHVPDRAPLFLRATARYRSTLHR